MQPNCLVSFILLLGLLQVCSSARVTRSLSAVQQQSTSFECGKPYGPCGTGVPAGVSCDGGPGFCQPGYFCAAENGTAPSRCLPVPANCGVAGGEHSVVLFAADLPAEVLVCLHGRSALHSLNFIMQLSSCQQSLQ